MRSAAALLLVVGCVAGGAHAADKRLPPPNERSWQLDTRASTLAVVTRKAGFAAGLAHDHLIAASIFAHDATIDFDRLERTRTTIVVRADDLVVDDDERRAAFEDRLVELGLLGEPFEPIDAKARARVRRAMLGRDQLDAERRPEIVGRLVSVGRGAPVEDRPDVREHLLRVELEVRGTTRETTLSARVVRGETSALVEAWGMLRFSDFGIEPYSAFLGAVRNRDELGLYVRLELVR